jgi:hypothetical protein
MTASIDHLRTLQQVVLALTIIVGTLDSASAQQPTLNTSGLTPQQCYQKDSGCTQFCGEVTGDLRYECFSICDRMLDRCLTTGDWTDSARVSPDTGRPPNKTDLLSGFFVRVLMVLSDTDGDGVVSPKEIESLKVKVFNTGSKTPAK